MNTSGGEFHLLSAGSNFPFGNAGKRMKRQGTIFFQSLYQKTVNLFTFAP